ncbi:hypothetical protein [Pseudomonas sp. BBP2017]|uniref:hypothetical protein n=1 Tax=Pseudomonas sp. BBP2017 TaxID=2109731 RepID=UPI000D1252EF|nr:hypothetical protein [Pseudomonas sp. BBP2017]PSS56319.1 hypothetical protein C6382_14615 [Pseudomonas sp. BBP2017]
MHEPNLTTRIICNDRELADQLHHLLVHTVPDCEVLTAPRDCSAAPFCRWLGEAPLGPAGQVQVALVEAIEVLERTRHAFKSRELGQLRQHLNALLDTLSDNPK